MLNDKAKELLEEYKNKFDTKFCNKVDQILNPSSNKKLTEREFHFVAEAECGKWLRNKYSNNKIRYEPDLGEELHTPDWVVYQEDDIIRIIEVKSVHNKTNKREKIEEIEKNAEQEAKKNGLARYSISSELILSKGEMIEKIFSRNFKRKLSKYSKLATNYNTKYDIFLFLQKDIMCHTTQDDYMENVIQRIKSFCSTKKINPPSNIYVLGAYSGSGRKPKTYHIEIKTDSVD
jgi:hypothetical protein